MTNESKVQAERDIPEWANKGLAYFAQVVVFLVLVLVLVAAVSVAIGQPLFE